MGTNGFVGPSFRASLRSRRIPRKRPLNTGVRNVCNPVCYPAPLTHRSLLRTQAGPSDAAKHRAGERGTDRYAVRLPGFLGSARNDGHRAAGQDTAGSVQIVDCLDRSGCLVPASWQLQMYKNTSSGNSAAASWSSYNFCRNSLPLIGGERRPFFGRRERVLFQRAFCGARLGIRQGCLNSLASTPFSALFTCTFQNLRTRVQ